MNQPINRTAALTPTQRTAVQDLVDRVASHDGVNPLNEAARFALEGLGHGVHWLAYLDCQLVGYAQADRENHSVQLLVDPVHRRRGIGSRLVEAVREVEPGASWWAFDNQAGAQGLADKLGARIVRQLLVMERDLQRHPVEPCPAPEGVEIRAYEPADAIALVEVNADAFVHHPEQGDMTLADFQLRTQEPWFDPEGLMVARDDDSGAFLGFHWTKIEAADPANPDELVGEVYVIAVDPAASGRGIGRALLTAGLEHLAAQGVHRVKLYVEASEVRVVKMYESAKFILLTKDVSYLV